MRVLGVPASDEIPAALRSRQRYRRAFLTALSTLGARGVAIVTAVAVVPLTLGYLGPDGCRSWATVTSLAAFLIFADLGLGNSLLTAVARADGRQDAQAQSKTVATGMWMLTGAGFAFGVLAILANGLIDWGQVLNLRDEIARTEAGSAMLVLALCYAGSLPLSGVTQVRNGLQQGYINGVFVAAGNLLGLALVVLAVQARLGLPLVVLAFMGAPLVSGLANAAALFWKHPNLTPSFRHVSAPMAAQLARSGGQFLILQLAMAAAFYSDTLIAASVIGPTAAAEYNVASTLFLAPMGLVAAGLAPLWPAYGEAMARGDTTWIRLTLRRSLIIALAISGPCAVLVVLLADPILVLWIDKAVVPGTTLIVGMALWTVWRSVGTGMAMLLNGLHLLRVQVATAVVMAALNVTLSILLTMQIGVAGVIYGTVIAYTVATLIPLGIYLPRALRKLEASR